MENTRTSDSSPSTDPRLDDAERMAAPRDASFYNSSHGRGRGAHVFHVLTLRHWSGCGTLLQGERAVPAASVSESERCRRPGCRVRWPREARS